ncbi:MAG: FecR domain-containing protein [Leptonema sp. (in: bacteria)]
MIQLKEKNIKIIKISSKKEDSIFVSVGILLLILISFLLYKDIYTTYQGLGEPVGKVIFKKKVALRKIKNQSIWEYIQSEYPIYNGDSIKTEELSEAVLRLQDGTEISINENSYIVINLLGEEAKINFNYGSLEANTENKNLKIQTKDSEILLSSANAKLVNKNESLQIQLEKGEANLKTKGKEEKLKENEIALLNKESNEIKKEKNTIKLLSPEDNAKFYTNDRIAVQFQIEGDPTEIYDLVLSNNPTFSNLVLRKPIKNQIIVDLSPGIYFWKIITKNSNSQINYYKKFSIIRKEKINLLYPKNGELFSFKENQNINFSWTNSENAPSYEIWIDTNKNFSNPKKISTFTNFISIPLEIKEEKIEYFWKVVPITNEKESVTESNIYSFIVQKMEKEKPAIPITPISETFFVQELQKGIRFYWKIENPKNQILQIAKDKSFQQIVYEKEISQNFYIFKENLQPGTYYWRILNLDKVESNIADFFISDKIEITLLYPTKNQSFFIPKVSEILFKWKLSENIFSFQMVLAKDPQFVKPLHKINLNSENYLLDLKKFNFEEGNYFWKIIVYDKENTKALAEAFSNFKIYYVPETPQWLQPTTNPTYDVNKINTIFFQWTKTKFTDYYEFEIYKNTVLADKYRLYANLLEYNPFKKLSLGKFRAVVRSVREIDKETIKSEDIYMDFILEQKINQKPEFLTPKKIYID